MNFGGEGTAVEDMATYYLILYSKYDSKIMQRCAQRYRERWRERGGKGVRVLTRLKN